MPNLLYPPRSPGQSFTKGPARRQNITELEKALGMVQELKETQHNRKLLEQFSTGAPEVGTRPEQPLGMLERVLGLVNPVAPYTGAGTQVEQNLLLNRGQQRIARGVREEERGFQRGIREEERGFKREEALLKPKAPLRIDETDRLKLTSLYRQLEVLNKEAPYSIRSLTGKGAEERKKIQDQIDEVVAKYQDLSQEQAPAQEQVQEQPTADSYSNEQIEAELRRRGKLR